MCIIEKKNVLWNLSKFDIGLEETGRERRGEDQNREKIEKMLSNRKINEAPPRNIKWPCLPTVV